VYSVCSLVIRSSHLSLPLIFLITPWIEILKECQKGKCLHYIINIIISQNHNHVTCVIQAIIFHVILHNQKKYLCFLLMVINRRGLHEDYTRHYLLPTTFTRYVPFISEDKSCNIYGIYYSI